MIILAFVGMLWFYKSYTDKMSTGEQISNLISKKYNKSPNEVITEVAIDTGKFSKGTLRFKDQAGGGIWFAAKTLNGWELAYDGNGIVPCEIVNKYNFSTDIISQCIDGANSLINRLDTSVATWEAMKDLIVNCRVKSVMQSHDLSVSVELKNGQKFKGKEPKIDDVIYLSTESEGKCGKIIMGTE